jgi:hypothetical protein
VFKEQEPKPHHLTIEVLTEIASEAALSLGGHQPTIVVEGVDKTLVTKITELAESHEGRLFQMYSAGWIVAQSGQIGILEQVFLVTEAWLSLREPDHDPQLAPSEDSRRKEVLIISAYTINQDKVDIRIKEMIRDEDGTLSALQTIDFPNEEGMSYDAPLLTHFVLGYAMGLMETPH